MFCQASFIPGHPLWVLWTSELQIVNVGAGSKSALFYSYNNGCCGFFNYKCHRAGLEPAPTYIKKAP